MRTGTVPADVVKSTVSSKVLSPVIPASTVKVNPAYGYSVTGSPSISVTPDGSDSAVTSTGVERAL